MWSNSEQTGERIFQNLCEERFCHTQRNWSASLIQQAITAWLMYVIVNIHSHLIGSLLFFSLPAWTFLVVFAEYANTSRLDVLVFSTFYFGVAICFLLSSTFHVINNHSRRIAAFGNQLDYLGIVLLMWGATIPTVYYGFHDDIKLRNLYWTVVSILGAACCIATLHPKFRTPTFRPYRSMMYAALGLSAIVFIIHAISLRGFAEANRRMSLDWMGAMALLNLTGAVTYGTRIPEKLRPGKFDVYGSSHQVLHFMVIFAGLAHMFGLIRAYRYYHTTLLGHR